MLVVTATTVLFGPVSRGVEIVSMEYFIDDDPGVGNGEPLGDFTPAEFVSLPMTVPLAEFEAGLHMLHVRAIDSDGNSSHLAARAFVVNRDPTLQVDVTGLRYAIDADPREGALLPAPTVEDSLTLSGVEPGLHTLYVVASDTVEGTSGIAARSFVKQTDPAAVIQVAHLEYSLDTDAEPGDTVSLAVPAGQFTDLSTVIPLTGIAEGTAVLTVRVVDDQGLTGIPASRSVAKTSSILESPPFLDRLHYWVVPESGGASLVDQVIPVGDQATVDQNLADALSPLVRGETYRLLVQAVDVSGSWSGPIQDDFRFVCLEDLWTDRFFTEEQLLDPNISGPDADPNQNGIPNRVEIVLASDPLSSGSGWTPLAPPENGDTFRIRGRSWRGGTGVPFLDYWINGYHMRCEVTTNLESGDWVAADTVLDVNVQSSPDLFFTDDVELQVTDEASAASLQYFFRMIIESPPECAPFALFEKPAL